MTWLHRLFARTKMEEQLDKELRFHIEEYAEDLIARGRDPEEARTEARLELGGPEQVKEDVAMPVARAGHRSCGRICGTPCAPCARSRGLPRSRY